MGVSNLLPHTKKPVSLFVIITLIISLCMITPCMIAGIYFYATLRNSTFDTIERNIDSSAESSFSSVSYTHLDVYKRQIINQVRTMIRGKRITQQNLRLLKSLKLLQKPSAQKQATAV